MTGRTKGFRECVCWEEGKEEAETKVNRIKESKHLREECEIVITETRFFEI